MKEYRLVFTDIHRHMDYIGKASDQTLVMTIQDMLKGGRLMLSELTEVTEES